MSISKFNEVNAPPRISAQALWPDSQVLGGGQDLKQDSIYKKSGVSLRQTPEKEVVNMQNRKNEQMQLMS